MWETNSSKSFSHVSDLKITGGFFTLQIEPDSLNSVTTNTGQGKGKAAPPSSAPYPVLYSDDFDSDVRGNGQWRLISTAYKRKLFLLQEGFLRCPVNDIIWS